MPVSQFTPGVRRWLWPIGLSMTCVALWGCGDAVRTALEWVPGVLLSQPWRVLTAHLVHLDGLHLALNLVGLGALWAVVGAAWRTGAWSVIAVFVALATGLSLSLVPGLAGYVGLSGVLHGLLAAGAVGIWHTARGTALVLLLFLVLKGLAEAWTGGLGSENAVVEAHWLGTAAGTLAGIMCLFWMRRSG